MSNNVGNPAVMNVADLAALVYGTDEPTKGQRNAIAAMCRDGRLDAAKVGRRWLIRVEWPGACADAERARA